MKKENIEKKTCPNCGSKNLIKKGTRKNKLKEVRVYFCKDCLKKFSDSNFINKTYSISQIVKTLSYYNKGLTIKEISEKKSIPTSTIANWISEYREVFTMIDLASKIRKFKEQNKIIETHKYNHGVIYLYQHHKYKLENIAKKSFPKLYGYLYDARNGKIDKNIFANCSSRASEVKLNIDEIKVSRSANNNSGIAKMALELARDNKRRHWAVEKVLLENDTITVATEVPVYLDTAKSSMPFLRTLAASEGYITGHIDILQLRGDDVVILDYKPEAAKEKPLGQLFIYACCLSRLTGLHFAKIKLAWFDEFDYFETNTMDVYKNVMKTFKK
ncbi:MAG: helix-turn-helix domain-containing protein [Bacteroidales bacterium]|nr:helix-turn-helix domain-containing protein [Bacteroidales bacterium]